MPGDDIHVLDVIQRPYRSKFAQSRCRHLNAINVNLGYNFVTDMLVLEIALDNERIDTQRNDNPWLIRAAQSLAEAFRLAASKELDVEFTELVTGYRLRGNYKGTFVDIYLYDSLSSGAGYAVSVADEIELLLDKVEELLRNCDCENACHNCLKHYRNHHVHGLLDRFAALELLDWGRKGILAQAISNEKQVVYVDTLTHILDMSGCKINIMSDSITVCRQGKQKQIVVYPAMWVEPYSKDTIFISDSLIKYAKPYAIQKIIEGC